MKNIKKEIALVCLAAGVSSRFGGRLKQFVEIRSGETLVEYSLSQALKADFSKIIFVVGEKTKKPFEEKFGKSYKNLPVYYASQTYDKSYRNKPWGTADALCSAAPFLDCSFVVCNGDDIYGEHTFEILIKHLKKDLKKGKNAADATISYKLIDALPEKGIVNRGIIQAEKGYIKEIKDCVSISKSDLRGKNPEDLCAMGVFGFNLKTLKLLNQGLQEFKKEHKGDAKAECGLPDQITDLIKAGKIKMKIYPAKDKWLGVTNPEDEEKVRKILG